MTPRPKLLWIPHTPWGHCQAQRPRLLVEALHERFDVHVVTWEAAPLDCPSRARYYLSPASHWRALRPRSWAEDGIVVHRAAVPLPVIQRLSRGYPPAWALALTQRLFQRSLRQIVRREQFAAAVVAASHHFTGYPPRMLGVPVLFDYLDASPPAVEAHYLELADRVVTVSHHLADLLRAKYDRDARVVPNGIHLDRLQRGNAARARAKWGLAGKRVVSLIGLTCSPRLYFLDALARLLPEFPDLVFVGAGGGSKANAIRARCAELGVPAVMTGWVDPSETPDLFAATDVGLYPGDDNPYFDGACPLKVLEYTALRVPVVTNRVAELIRLGFPSLIVRPATVEGLEDGLRQALSAPPTDFPDMAPYDWGRLAAAFGDEIDATISRSQ